MRPDKFFRGRRPRLHLVLERMSGQRKIRYAFPCAARVGMTYITLILARRELTEFKFLKRLMILSRPDCWMGMKMSYSA